MYVHVSCDDNARKEKPATLVELTLPMILSDYGKSRVGRRSHGSRL
jgi:hypothetical protein